MADLFRCMLDLLLGAIVGLEGEHVCGSLTPGFQWAAKSEREATQQECAEPHGQFTRIDDFITCHNLKQETHVDTIDAASMPE